MSSSASPRDHSANLAFRSPPTTTVRARERDGPEGRVGVFLERGKRGVAGETTVGVGGFGPDANGAVDVGGGEERRRLPGGVGGGDVDVGDGGFTGDWRDDDDAVEGRRRPG